MVFLKSSNGVCVFLNYIHSNTNRILTPSLKGSKPQRLDATQRETAASKSSPKAQIRPETTRQRKRKNKWMALWTLAAKQKSARARANARSAFFFKFELNTIRILTPDAKR